MGRAGVAQLVVSRRGRCFVVCASRSLRGAKKHRTAVGLGTLVSIRAPVRIPPVSTARALRSARRKAAGLITVSRRLYFGGFAPRAWRVSAGRLGGIEFVWHSTCAFGSFFIPPFGPS